MTYRAAKSVVDKLVEIGISRQFAEIYPMVFYAPEVLKVSLTPSLEPELP